MFLRSLSEGRLGDKRKPTMSKLFSPLRIQTIELKNRIVVSPMCQYSSEDGFANDWHLVHLGSRAVGGAGLVIFEATAVEPEGRISPDDLGIWKDEHIDFLKRINRFIHDNGSVAGIQLAHAGRKAATQAPWKGYGPLTKEEGAWRVIGPSAIAFKDGYQMPHEMSKEDINSMIEKFRKAALRALEADFKVVEIHAAHGYLIHEFYSPYSNKRTDNYGGSFENRIRFLLEITNAVREVWPSTLPLFVRISGTDWIENGWTVEESIELAAILKQLGVDVIDCSTGGNVPGVKIPVGPSYQVSFAEQIRSAGILTGAVGMITEATQAEEILQQCKADLIVMARQLLREPYFPLHAAHKLGEDIAWPPQYERAKLH